MNILQAIKDEKLFRPFLEDGDGAVRSWSGWFAALRALYGLPLKNCRRLRTITERDQFPDDGFNTALFLTGRRSGKSRIAAVIGAYEAVLAGHEQNLSKGEKGYVPICSPTKKQSRIVKGYIRAIFDTPLLKNEVVKEDKEGFDLRNGNRIEILTGDFRTIRGYTLIAAIVDEICFFGVDDDDSKIKSDTELIRAVKPGLATVQGKLVCISSPYAKKGWSYKQFKKHFGNDESTSTLVVNCPSRTLNPTLPQRIVDEAMEEDRASALAEYYGQFRDDIVDYITTEMVQAVVVTGRRELPPDRTSQYHAFVDVSGGRADDAALAIGHREGRCVVVDFVQRWRPPFNPYAVIHDMGREIKRYGIRKVVGDNYAAEFVASAFTEQGFRYRKSDQNKSALYLEMLPRITSREVELLDNEFAVKQIAALERRTRSGGKDSVDHPHGGHDDVANVIAGVIVHASAKNQRLGALPRAEDVRSY